MQTSRGSRITRARFWKGLRKREHRGRYPRRPSCRRSSPRHRLRSLSAHQRSASNRAARTTASPTPRPR
eukprot:1036100-Prymnesium_polylepis.1